ncbi:hypothetical protein KR94_18135 [Pantoea ananatis]|nr:hypothetical protein KR94_18135 [Pantoea ananatis]
MFATLLQNAWQKEKTFAEIIVPSRYETFYNNIFNLPSLWSEPHNYWDLQPWFIVPTVLSAINSQF